MMGVPTFYTRLLDDERFTRELVSHIRLFVSGSAPLLAETHIETHPIKRRAHREIAMVWRKSTSRADEFEELGRHLCDAIGKSG